MTIEQNITLLKRIKDSSSCSSSLLIIKILKLKHNRQLKYIYKIKISNIKFVRIDFFPKISNNCQFKK